MKVKILIPIFIFIMFLFLVSGSTIFSSNFDYNTTYVLNGISYFKSTGVNFDSPQYSNRLLSNACGINTTDPGGAGGFSQYVYANLPSLITDGVFQATFKVNYESGSPFTLILSNTSFTSDYFNIQFSGANIHIFENTPQISGLEICDFNTTATYSYIVVFNYNVVTKKYNILISNLTGSNVFSCLDKTLSTTPVIFDKFVVRFDYVKLEATEKFIDDLVIDYTSVNYTYLPVSSYCDLDSECISGYCLRHICAYKQYLQICAGAYECLSNSCINNHCTKESLMTQIDASKTELWGNDTGTNNFIAIVFILFIVVLVSVKTHFLVGVGAFVLLSILFTIIGWLSPFLLLGGLVMILGSIAILMFMGNSGN